MSRDSRSIFSEEYLNAFVDNQLTAEEKGQAYLEIGQDQHLNRQVCELRKMHDLVQLAYQDIPPAPAARQTPRRRRGFGVAAALLLALGVVLGMQINVQRAPLQTARSGNPAAPAARLSGASTPVANRAAARPLALLTTAADTRVNEPVLAEAPIPPRTPLPAQGVKNKVLIHLTDDKSSQLDAALDEIESLMRYYRESQQTAHVEVVMNGRGLDLVRVDTATHAARVAKLQREYRNLTFAACQNTIERLQREQNIAIRLLPGVITIDSGMAEIMRRQNQGWTYLQV